MNAQQRQSVAGHCCESHSHTTRGPPLGTEPPSLSSHAEQMGGWTSSSRGQIPTWLGVIKPVEPSLLSGLECPLARLACNCSCTVPPTKLSAARLLEVNVVSCAHTVLRVEHVLCRAAPMTSTKRKQEGLVVMQNMTGFAEVRDPEVRDARHNSGSKGSLMIYKDDLDELQRAVCHFY